MRNYGVLALLLVLVLAPRNADGGDPSILAPFRFQPSDQSLTVLEGERARIYRSQVQSQLRTLDRKAAGGDLNGRQRLLLLDTRSESQRLDRLVRQPKRIDLGIPQGGQLPSLSTGIRRRQP